jgi:hypothetical protein
MGRVKALLVVLVLLAALLVAADRVGVYEAQQLVSNKLASTYHLGERPAVDIKGVPFLTQWASGDFQEIDVDLGSANAGGMQVTDVTAQMKDVSTKAFARSGQDVAGSRIGTLGLTGTVSYASIPVPDGFKLSPSGDKLQLSGSYSVFGRSIPVTALISVGVSGGHLQMHVDQVQSSNSYISQVVGAAIDRQIQSQAFLRQLPLGVQLDSATVGADGLHITGSARKLTLPASIPTPA